MAEPAPLAPPLVPPEVDLRGNDWFPLYHHRLAGSVWWRTASHVARSCNIDLWMAAYRQVPAGSLPDDDRELAVACGMHRDMDAFRALKAELLETWVLCSDGRWHQPVLAEICLETWERLGEARRRERERSARRRAELRKGADPDRPETTRSPPGLRPESPTQNKTGQDTTSPAPAAPKRAVARAAQDGWRGDEAFQAAWDSCTRKMRLRSKSRDHAWPLWKRAAAQAGGGERLLAALRLYLRKAPDLDRTGGPGFHRWLGDGTWQHWLSEDPPPPAEPADPLAEWRGRVREWRSNGYWPGDAGPRPGEPGCRCPAAALEDFTLSPTATAKETSP